MSNLKYKHTAYTSAQWASLNPVIVENEIVIESDTKRTKIGNGISTYNELEYAAAYSVGNYLGSIKPTDAAPTPARNGNYTFSIGGNKPAWLTAEAGVTEVKAGDGVSVVYTEPSTYSYTHVNVNSDLYAIKEELIPINNRSIYSGALTSKVLINGENITWNTGTGFGVIPSRITFRGLPAIANINSKAVITVASGYRAGVIFFKTNNWNLTDYVQGFSWKTGTSIWEYLGTENVGYITVAVSKTNDSNITPAEALAAITSFQMTGRDVDETKNVLLQSKLDHATIQQNTTDIITANNRAIYSGTLSTKILENGENITWNTGTGFGVTPSRITFRGLPAIANINSKAVITVASGYRAGVIFFKDKTYNQNSYVQGFSWKTGTSTWEYLGTENVGYITVAVSKTNDSNITPAEALAAITSFQMTGRDVDDTLKTLIAANNSTIEIEELKTQIPIDSNYSGQKIDISTGHKFNFSHLIDLNSTGDFTLAGNNSNQGLAIYGNYLVELFNTGVCAIINMTNNTLVAIFNLPNYGSTNHANAAKFSKIWIEGNSVFPLLYVSECYGAHSCFVYSLTLAGATLIQTINYNGSGYENTNAYDWTPDFELGYIYTFGNETNSGDVNNRIVIKKFLLPSISSGVNITLGNADVLDTFYNKDVKVYQQNLVIANKMFCCHGYGNNPSGIIVIDLNTKNTISTIDTSTILGLEPEGLDIYEDYLVVSFQGNKGILYKFTF